MAKTITQSPRKTITPISAGIADALGNEKTDAKKTRAKITYVPKELPAEGYIRKPSFLMALGISNSSLHNGIKAGKIPPGKLLSPRCRVWNVNEVRAYLASIESEATA